MRKHLFLVFVAVSLATTGGAVRLAAQSGSVTFAKEINFSAYKTCKWVPVESAQRLDSLTTEQLIGTLETQFAKKGLTRSQSDDADLLIGFQVTQDGDKRIHPAAIGASYGAPARGASASGAVSAPIVHSGQLVLDMYDTEKKVLVWRGIVSDAFDANAKPDKKQKHMDKAVEKLLKDYPPHKS
ncbi:MAG TPA: DUF4136 domain-containing protein [Candidatus Acidoferrum sp.]|nr:DUF4136 domain-containing protein [Candidatus Acidoferrum sp.]